MQADVLPNRKDKTLQVGGDGACQPSVQDIDTALRECVSRQCSASGLYSMIQYHLGFAASGLEPARRGKRMRALLAGAIGSALGVDRSVLEPLIAASEMMHSASLVHDDIQDEDPLRWNRETVWKRFGVAHAINVGDAMIGLTYELLASLVKRGVGEARVLELLRVFNESHLRMTEGQYLDMAMQRNADATLGQYYEMIALKTGAACSCVCRSAAILGMASDDAIDGFARYGWALGIFYQICDDIASVWGKEECTGKTPLQDALLDKSSLPMLLAVEKGDQRSLSLIVRLRSFHGRVAPPDLCESVRISLKDSGVYDECLRHAQRLHADAAGALASTGAPEAAKEMLALILNACGAGVGDLASAESDAS